MPLGNIQESKCSAIVSEGVSRRGTQYKSAKLTEVKRDALTTQGFQSRVVALEGVSRRKHHTVACLVNLKCQLASSEGL